jgi:tetratricopeptide (TPR) repeat protein
MTARLRDAAAEAAAVEAETWRTQALRFLVRALMDLQEEAWALSVLGRMPEIDQTQYARGDVAIRLARRGESARAIGFLEAVKLSNARGWAIAEVAKELEASGDLAGLATLEPVAPGVTARAGARAAIERGAFDEAIEMIRSGEPSRYWRDDVLLKAARAAADRGLVAPALAASGYIEDRWSHIVALSAAAGAQVRNGDRDGALATIGQALRMIGMGLELHAVEGAWDTVIRDLLPIDGGDSALPALLNEPDDEIRLRGLIEIASWRVAHGRAAEARQLIESIESALSGAPDEAYYRTRFLMAAGEIGATLAAAERAQAPIEIYATIGRRLGRDGSATEIPDLVSRSRPTRAAAIWLGYGEARAQAGDAQGAVASYSEALDLLTRSTIVGDGFAETAWVARSILLAVARRPGP